MKYKTLIKSSAVVLVVILGVGAYFFFEKKSESNIEQQPESSVTQEKGVDKSKRISSVSPKGKPVTISFNRCGSQNSHLCFGSGAKSLGNGLWDMVSTSNKLYFGIESKTNGVWPYTAEIDFKGNVYDAAEYEYFKNKIQELFSQTVNAKN